ncbi:MAG: magnesium transporter [Cyclobacteriaceae bacterium]
MKHPITAEDYLVTDIPIANERDRVGDVIEMFKSKSFACSEYLYVTDSNNNLLAKLSSMSLLTLPVNKRIVECIRQSPRPKYILSDAQQERIGNFALQHNLNSLPVLDKEKGLIGVIPPGVIIRILRKEHIEDMHQLAGINKQVRQVRQSVEETPMIRVKDRLPWLILGTVGSMGATLFMSKFESTLESRITLAFFLPGIVYLADAIGTQSETIAVRGISLSDISFRKLLLAEVATGLAIGLILALIFFPFVWLIYHDILLSITVGVSILFAGGIASTIGLFFPWLLHCFNIDPAYGSGPIATIIQDILSILIYLTLATLIML